MYNQGEPMTRILLVEDTPCLRYTYSRLLKLHGFEVFEATDGREALEHVNEFQPDLVLTDLMMPGMGGLELIRRLRGDLRTAKLPILAMTGDSGALTDSRALQAGAADVLTKPVDLSLLLERIRAFQD